MKNKKLIRESIINRLLTNNPSFTVEEKYHGKVTLSHNTRSVVAKMFLSKPFPTQERYNGWHTLHSDDLDKVSGIDIYIFVIVNDELNREESFLFTYDEIQNLMKNRIDNVKEPFYWYFGWDNNKNFGEFRHGPITGLDYAYERWTLPTELVANK